MNLIIFEDQQAEGFHPIAVSHPAFDLFYGCFNVVDRLKHQFKTDNIFLFCRDYLADVARARYDFPVNDLDGLEGDSILVNAALVPDETMLEKLGRCEENTVYISDGRLSGGRLPSKLAKKFPFKKIPQNLSLPAPGIKSKKIKARYFNYLWEIINSNTELIQDDVRLIPGIQGWRRSTSTARYGDRSYIHPSANIMTGVYIDDSSGPVIIDDGAKVEPRTLIQGPAYIGKGTVLMGGIIREGCSLGPVCKVGGELEKSIIMGYTNKCHEGFIGHAYLGEWVNLGALTTNSDLKNNYGEIKVSIKGKMHDTESIKVGSFIGDHTKTGIGTLLNTGIVIGFGNNLYGGGLFAEKEIGHFKWGTPGNLTEYRLEKAMEVAKAAMARRGQNFDNSQKAMFKQISTM
jgi:UDP-N-acetylglucosamine diphosphorylase/glucosamine-1-phosphate N-acetyltransferase